jgi:hypothetical protein
MIRSLALGLVLATGALFGKLPPGEGQTAAAGQPPPFVVTPVQPPTGAPSIAPPSKKAPLENLFQNRPQTPPDHDVAAALVEQLADKTKVVCGLTMSQVDPHRRRNRISTRSLTSRFDASHRRCAAIDGSGWCIWRWRTTSTGAGHRTHRKL